MEKLKNEIMDILGIEKENRDKQEQDAKDIALYLKKNNIKLNNNITILCDDDYVYNKNIEIKKEIKRIKKYKIVEIF